MRIAGRIFLCIFAADLASAETNISINDAAIHASGDSITVASQAIIVDGKVVSGNIVEGSGEISSAPCTPGDFEQLQLDIAADVVITAGETTRCTVTADDNILPLILTESRDNVLRISARGSYVTSRKIGIVLQAPPLTNAIINGSGRITLIDVSQNAIVLAISGSGAIKANGKVEALSVAINGSGDVSTGDLEAESATVTINGSGNASVYAAAALTADVNGSGTVRYRGMPPVVRSSVRGSGGIAGD